MILCCSACVTYVPVTKPLPAEIRLPDNRGEILLVNRFDTSALDFNSDNKAEVFREGLEKYIQGLADGFLSNDHFNLHPGDSLLRLPMVEIPPDIVRNLCDQKEKEYLMSLDDFSLYFDQEMEVIKNDDGSKSRTAHYILVAMVRTTFYDSEGSVLHRAQDQQRVLYDSRAVLSGLLAVGPSMGKAGKVVNELAYQLGSSHINKFLPGSTIEIREFFVSKGFGSAHSAYEAGNWKKAEEELLKLSESADTKVSGRAAYNLAVLYENLGAWEKTTHWYGLAKTKLGAKTPIIPLTNYVQEY